ncbi:Fic family protein [Candidatus Bathyarchaeota archaeon]|nr:Fic family protein [Candidatus Bathyarchaeota archaeon]
MKLYRVESQRLKSSEIFYLVKDVRVKDRKAKVRKRIGKTRPTKEEISKIISTPDIDLERKALNKKISMSSGLYRSRYLQLQGLPYLEKTKYRDEFLSLFLTVSEEKYFEEKYEAEYVHGTTSIEGNTFTVQQVDELLQKRIPPSGKSLREINEVQNYLKVKEYRDSYKGRVMIPFILRLHKLIMDNVDVESAGRFRRIDGIGIKGCDIAVTPAIEIERELQAIIDEYYANIKAGWHPFEEAVLFHYRFEMIHPFTDGNGRVGREILNYMLTRAKYPRLIITKADQEDYITALQYGNQGLFELMVSTFVVLLQDERVDLFERLLEKNEWRSKSTE